MRTDWSHLEKFRVAPPAYIPARAGRREGVFLLAMPPKMGGHKLNVIASDGWDWEAVGLAPPAFEHVSASLAGRTDRQPTWRQMCWVKDLFWRDDELVIQYHPPRAMYINCHPGTLHLWRPLGVSIPLPPTETVGPSGNTTASFLGDE